jgi:hypothetical protein
MPQHTAMGILGDILLISGEVHIDGRYVREVAYNTGSGTIPTIGSAVSWNSSAGTGKVIKLNSGNNASGIMTITVQSGANPSGTITNGTWTATVASDKVGYLMVFGESQVWDATDATCTLRITGDWYELGVGTGANGQSFTLPHNGWQHAIWVETGSGTGVYEMWHRVYQNGVNGGAVSAVFYDAVTDWGNSFETGFVFYNDRTAGTVVVGTSTNGGVIPSGAKVRIPNVHIGTTTTAAPFTEYVGVAVASCLVIVDNDVTENVFIDHLNASTSRASLVGTNGGTISDSCFGWINATNEINKNNAPVTITNCAYILGNGLTGDSQTATFIIQDNVGGITIDSCIIYGGLNNMNSRGCNLVTMANILFKGRNKIPSNQQDENSHYALGGSVASNVKFEDDIIFNSAGIILAAGCVNWEIENIIWSQNTARGTAEDAMQLFNATGVDSITIQGGRFAVGSGVRMCAAGLFTITDSSRITIRNFGAVDAKIAGDSRTTTVVNCAGITNNCLFQRLYFTGLNTALPFTVLNSCKDIVFENCSGDYNDELELMSNSTIMKGIHGASGNIGTTTGWEDDYINVSDSVFYDCFKSDTAGGVGLIFNPLGVTYSSNFSIDAGTPVFNGIGDLRMQAVGDQVTYTFPYSIKGHTGFTSILPHLLGVNCGTLGSGWGNFTVEYDLDTGSGYSGSFKTASTANLTSETISPSGFRIKMRIRCLTDNTTNSIRGLQFHTSTTIADQKANLYPLDVTTLTLTGIVSGSDIVVLQAGTETVLSQVDQNIGSSWVYDYEVPTVVDIFVSKAGYIPFYIRNYSLSSTNASLPIAQVIDRNYTT